MTRCSRCSARLRVEVYFIFELTDEAAWLYTCTGCGSTESYERKGSEAPRLRQATEAAQA